VEHIVGYQDYARLLGRAIEEVVEVGVHTEDITLWLGLVDHRHKHLLTLRQVITIRHRDFETKVWITEMVEDATPEGDILIPLDIYPHQISIILRRQNIGQLLRIICRKITAATKSFLRFHIVKLQKNS
jgi:hypothetical protein